MRAGIIDIAVRRDPSSNWGANRTSPRNSQLGATVLEYALVLSIFLTVLFGIGAFGHALFTYHHLNNAAKEATRYAAVRGSTCSNDNSCVTSNSASGITGPTTQADVTQYVQNITPQSIDASRLTVTICGVSDSGGCASSGPQICTAAVGSVPNYPGCTVQVQVQYAYNFIFPFITTSSVNMSSTSEMVIVH